MRNRGQATVEYMLLLCSVLVLVMLAGAFLNKVGRELLDELAYRLLEAALTLAMP